MWIFKSYGLFFKSWIHYGTYIFMIFTAVNYISNEIHGGDLYLFFLIISLCFVIGFVFCFFKLINVKDDENERA